MLDLHVESAVGNEVMNFERLETEFIGTYGLICNFSQSPISFFPKGSSEI